MICVITQVTQTPLVRRVWHRLETLGICWWFKLLWIPAVAVSCQLWKGWFNFMLITYYIFYSFKITVVAVLGAICSCLTMIFGMNIICLNAFWYHFIGLAFSECVYQMGRKEDTNILRRPALLVLTHSAPSTYVHVPAQSSRTIPKYRVLLLLVPIIVLKCWWVVQKGVLDTTKHCSLKWMGLCVT